MTSKAGLQWKMRGYPYKVTHNHAIDDWLPALDWVVDNLPHGSWVKTNFQDWVFSQEEYAILFQLTWCYEQPTS